MLGSRFARLAQLLAVMLAVLVLLPGMALADNLDSDGDGVTPVTNSNLSFGSVCRGVATPKTVLIAVRRNGTAGSTNVYKDSSSVTVTGATSSSGLAVTNPDSSIAIPSNWGAQPNNTMSAAVSATVTLTAPATGPYSGSITWTGSGVRSDDTALTRDDAMSVSATVTNCDSTPPETTIDSAPSSPTGSTSASFTYSSNESGSTFQCKLDLGSFASCPSAGKSYTGLGEGSHTFEVRATDAAGNVDASPDSHTWIIDLTAPDTTIVTGPPVLTNSDDAAFTYSSTEAGSGFECDLDGDGFASCPAAGESYSGLDEGSHTFAVRATDGAGNTDASPDTHSWTIDLTPPAVSAPDLSNASDSGSSQVDDVTNDATPDLAGTAEDGATVELLRDGSPVASTVATGGTWSFTSGALAEGTYTFAARATDPAGNVATSGGLDVVVDLTDPVITLASRLPAPNGAGWNNSAVTVTWDCTDALSGATTAGDSDTLSGEGAGQTANGACADVAGNTANDSVGGISIDLTNPSITMASRLPAANGAGWNNSAVTVTWDCADGLSGATAPTVSDTKSGEGAGQTANGQCADAAGNTASASLGGISIDLTAPSITQASRLPAPNGAGWNNSAVTVTWDCADDLSGPAATGDSETLSGEGAGQTANGQCADVAGNAASDSVGGINIDLTAPEASASATSNGSPYAAGTWTKYDVVVTFGCTDGLSGVASLTDPATRGEGENQSASGTCTDLAGNSDGAIFSDIDVDKTAPVATASAKTADDAAYAGGTWTNQDVTVTFDCTDALSGVASLTPPSSTFGADGANQSASTECVDNAGNAAGASFGDIDIDKTAPVITFVSRVAAPNLAGWNNAPVTVTWSCADALSGAVAASVSDTKSAEGIDQTANGLCADLAGNTAGASVSNIDIDLTDPHDITWIGGPADGASYHFGSVPAAPTCSATDDLSGMASCTVGGHAATVGSHTMTATALDAAGNEASVTRSYTVLAWTLRGFYQPVDMNGVWNTVKGGSTVPLKWEVFAGSTELTDISLVALEAKQLSCTSGGVEDAVEVTATGGTVLRYDTTGGQFIYNWQTPKKPGSCYQVTMTTDDGSSITAKFRLK